MADIRILYPYGQSTFLHKKMKILQTPSPNFNDRRYDQADMVILHYTGMKTAEDAMIRMCEDKQPRVSAHYFINRQGEIFQLVAENKRAWHAGVSFWKGEKDINSRSIGIELENKGHEWGYETFPEVQVDSLIWLLKDIKTRYDIPLQNILSHSDVAPLRKKDVGEFFPWQRLMQEELIPLIRSQKIRAKGRLYPLTVPQFAKEVLPILRNIGYETDRVMCFTRKNRAALEAFQRRFTAFNRSQEQTRIMLHKVHKYYG